MFQVKAEILSHKKVAPDCFLMELRAGAIARRAQPGQFVHLRISDSVYPLLRRPFSLHRIRHRSVEILYQKKGEGTGLLSQRKAGEVLDLIGPLGNGFDLTGLPLDKRIILIGGGMGAAPLLSLAQELVKKRAKRKLFVFLGARSKAFILKEKEIRGLGIDCFISTDDDSYGKKGMITGLFEDKIRDWRKIPGMVFACGPKGMLKNMAHLSRKHGFPCQVSLEENMACGIGACLGCVVRVRSSEGAVYKRVCKDGPVFKAEEVIFE